MKGTGQLLLSAACLTALTAGAAAASLAGAYTNGLELSKRNAIVAKPAPKTAAFDLKDKTLLGDHKRLSKLNNDDNLCRQALKDAGVNYTELAALNDKGGCGYDEAIDANLAVSQTGEVMPMSCALVARLEVWKENVVQPAALKRFGSRVTEIEAFGAYSCRRVGGDGPLSKHAHAEAADISGFKLADGRLVSVKADYNDESKAGLFLREIHDKACKVFDVTLGPDYNADHANHFHLDVGGDSACR